MLKREDGMTVPELLTALTIAMIISLAAFGLVEVVMAKVGEIGGRVEATQRGRAAMDDITRQLRSQVCVNRTDSSPAMTGARSVYEAKKDSVTFFAELSDESYTGATSTMPIPKLRTFAYDAAGKTVLEKIKDGKEDTANYGQITYANATERTRKVMTGVALTQERVTPTAPLTDVPIFRYYGFNTATPPRPDRQLLPGVNGLSNADLQAVARIEVRFRSIAAKNKDGRTSSVFIDEVYVRSADPNSNSPKPTCA